MPKPSVEDVSVIDDHHSGPLFRQAEDPYEGKSFTEVLKAKREALERNMQAQKQPKQPAQSQIQSQPTDPDSIEGRKKRLQAQRDALLAKRKAERDKELEDYNKSQAGANLDAARNTFYKQMIKMDQAL